MHTGIKRQIISLCEANPVEESCGFIVLGQTGAELVTCTNVAPNPREDFKISPSEYVAATYRGQLLAVYHSHPVAAGFSPHDLQYAQEVALPQYLYSIPDKSWSEYIPPTYKPPLEGRRFVFGMADCYSLVRDYFRYNFNVYLNDYDRDESFHTVPSHDIMDLYVKEGGYKAVNIAQIKKHDVLVFTVANVLPQHFAIFVGNSRILHHTYRGLSRTDLFNGGWHNRLKAVLRHPAAG